MPGKRGLPMVVLLFFTFMYVCPAAGTAAEDFPEYDCISRNVTFWVKIYSEFTTSQAVVHDSTELDIIYDVIDLKPYDAPGSREINRKRMKRAKDKYADILNQLGRNAEITDPEYQRVAGLFGQRRQAAAFKQAATRIRCQVGQKDRFMAGVIRSGAYLEQIREILKSYGVPEDLAYLPHVESSFNPNAYSKFGAAGMWQFIRDTGKRYMQVGYVLDERRDPILSTHAAAQLLKANHAKLHNWPLAITAYNHGAAGMERARKMHGDYPEIFASYQGRAFKFASRNFYAEFLAARQVAADYKTYFGELVLDQPNRNRTIVLENYVALEDLQRHFGLSAKILAELNPALRPPVFNGQKYIPKGYKLRLPEETGSRESGLIARIPQSMYKSSQQPSLFYTVQRGDSAGKIARTHRVKLSDLILANNLNRHATIYPHQNLRIPQPGEQIAATRPVEPVKADETVLLAVNESPSNIITPPLSISQPQPQPELQLELQLEPGAEPQPEILGKSQAAEADQAHYPEPVLASIIPLSMIAPSEMPDLSASVLSGETEPSLEIVTGELRFEKVFNHKGKPVGILQVEVEETLGHYAEWARVRTHQIRRLNGLNFGDILNLHQKIKIPLHQTTAQLFEEDRYEYHKRLQEDFLAVYRLGEPLPYRIEQGDTFWTLSRSKFNVPMWLLQHCNPKIDLADLRMNEQILIPTIEKATSDEPVIGNGTTDEEIGSTDQSSNEGAL